MFFDQLFADTLIEKLPDDQRIIIREPKYFQQLDTALEEDADITKEGLGSYYPEFIFINNSINSKI